MMRGRHARLLGTSLHLVMGLLSLAQGVIHGGHCSRVFQEYLAVVGPPANSLAARYATSRPLCVLDVAVDYKDTFSLKSVKELFIN